MKPFFLFLALLLLAACSSSEQKEIPSTPFPIYLENIEENRPMSAAIKRSFEHYEAPRLLDNELYTNFRYTELKGFDYNGGDGTISRRDPSKIIAANGKYYVWYTHRQTKTHPQGYEKSTDSIPSKDWDLAEIWYATSTDGFTWEEQGVAVPRPPKPQPGWRSVATTDILVWEGKYYLYYQAYSSPSGKIDEKRGASDICPVAMSVADSPDGPWTPLNEVVIPLGEETDWDYRVIHDPSPFIHNGKVYLYYKSGMDKRDANNKYWDCWGLAIADRPEGPFEKHPLSPVTNSGHETMLFPFREGIAAIVGTDGIEHYTIQYAKDWVNFEIASVTQLLPVAGGAFAPDAFTDTPNADGISWGLSHFINAGNDWDKMYTKLARFDCDLSLSVNAPDLKKSNIRLPHDLYFQQRLNQKQRERIMEQNKIRLGQ